MLKPTIAMFVAAFVPGLAWATPADDLNQHIAEAKAIAGDLYQPVAEHLCYLHSPEDDVRLNARRAKAPLQATKVFDNFYYVGAEEVASWALTTSSGIVIFDTLDNPDEAKADIVQGMRKLGLDPMTIKYIVLTHGHGDHFGGATYLKSLTGAKILASDADKKLMQDSKSRAGGPAAWKTLVPDVDQIVTDGETFQLGNTEIAFHLTPGHTPGSVSSIFRVYDKGKPHMLAFWGGVGVPNQAGAISQYIESDTAFAKLAADANADVAITNHPHADMTLEWVHQIHESPAKPNPLIVGPANVARWFSVIKDCALAQQDRITGGLATAGRARTPATPGGR